MSLFNIFDTVINAVASVRVNSYVDTRISAGFRKFFKYYKLFVIVSCSAFVIGTLLFTIPFIVTRAMASILMLAICLAILILIVVTPFAAVPRLVWLLELRRQQKKSYNPIIGHGFLCASMEIREYIPFLILGTIIQVAVLVLCLFIMRKTVLGPIEDVGIFKLLLFPFTHSFDTIFRTHMSEALFGPF